MHHAVASNVERRCDNLAASAVFHTAIALRQYNLLQVLRRQCDLAVDSVLRYLAFVLFCRFYNSPATLQ